MKQIKFCISMTKDLYEKVKTQAKAKELTVLIATSKAKIRERFPD